MSRSCPAVLMEVPLLGLLRAFPGDHCPKEGLKMISIKILVKVLDVFMAKTGKLQAVERASLKDPGGIAFTADKRAAILSLRFEEIPMSIQQDRLRLT